MFMGDSCRLTIIISMEQKKFAFSTYIKCIAQLLCFF